MTKLTPEQVATMQEHADWYLSGSMPVRVFADLAIDYTVALLADRVSLVAELNAREWRTDLDAAPENTPIMLSDGDWVAEGYCLSDGSERDGTFWQANDHWTDAHDAQLLPTHWAPMPTPPSGN